MTKDEALKLALKFVEDTECGTADLEAAIKEAFAQPEQEPVAYLCENAVGHKYFRWKKPSSAYKPIALYTSTPQRTWVGLTDEEIEQMGLSNYIKVVRETEAKLKAKNT